MDLRAGKNKAKKYYDQVVQDYIRMYEQGYGAYPQNQIRLNFIVDRLKANRVKTILDVGCGTCVPMVRLLKEGFKSCGFDFSDVMLKEARSQVKAAGYDPALVFKGDLENSRSLPSRQFDAAIALGVFPHIINEQKALSNLRKVVKKGGVVLIEFRNDLFAAFTLNKYSMDFYLNRILNLKAMPSALANEVVDFYKKAFKYDKPLMKKKGKIHFSEILAKFHNPLSLDQELFQPCGFKQQKIHFYHYHALPPVFEPKNQDVFRRLSLQHEKTDDWRGYFMASAFVLEAKAV
ncbi:MAG: methyltransferase domain-containing protein [Candidatus Omnitrophica bacterium]|nr:methyltransferase domain-containing protein [Candidatus Omnitrophota bacterium]